VLTADSRTYGITPHGIGNLTCFESQNFGDLITFGTYFYAGPDNPCAL
jgi:hypothetical protein